MPRGADELCPLGFAPHSVRPTRCKRCFRDYSQHNKKTTPPDEDKPSTKDDAKKTTATVAPPSSGDDAGTASRPVAAATANISRRTDASPTRTASPSSKSALSPSGGASPARTASPSSKSALSPSGGASPTRTGSPSSKAALSPSGGATIQKSHSFEISSSGAATSDGATTDSATTTTVVVRRRRPQPGDAAATSGNGNGNSAPNGEESLAARRRFRTRPGSWSYSDNGSFDDDDTSNSSSISSRLSAVPATAQASRLSPRRTLTEKERGIKEQAEKETAAARAKQQQQLPAASPGQKRVQIVSAHELHRPSLQLDDYDMGESTSADVAFMLQVKQTTADAQLSREEADADDSVSTAATETTETTLTFHETVEELQATIHSLRQQSEEMERKCARLEADKLDAEKSQQQKASAELTKLRLKVFELESLNEDVKDENHVMKLELKEMQEELDKRAGGDELHRLNMELQHKLHAAEAMCDELMEENDEYKKEIGQLEDEMDELQDNFREEQADEYRDLKKRLEQTEKNCRIMQFKMRKAERRCELLESDKNQLDDRLRTLTNADNIDVDKVERMARLESEVGAAREVASRMHAEMQALRAALLQAETERETALAAAAASSKTSAGKASSAKTNGEAKSKEQRLGLPAVSRPLTPTGKGADDSAQLMRELYDSMEREKDLKEQFKFSEEEAKSLRKKLSSLEDENEGLVLQVKKMATGNRQTARGKLRSNSPDMMSGAKSGGGGGVLGAELEKQLQEVSAAQAAEEDTLSLVELKLQTELLEQENRVLRKKLEEKEAENEGLHREMTLLETKLRDDKRMSEKVDAMPESGSGDAYYEQRIQLLEQEAKELRRKLIDKERENEQLGAEVESGARLLRRGSKAVPPVQRSRSLDGDAPAQVDVRRQLQLVEQEASVLRQKMLTMEAENEKLQAENRKLQLRGNRKGPVTANEKLALENSQLKDSVTALEKKLSGAAKVGASTTTGAKTPLKKTVTTAAAATTDQDGSGAGPKKTLTAKLKEQVAKLESEMGVMKQRLDEVEKENSNLKKQKNASNLNKRTPSAESQAAAETKAHMDDLQEQIQKLSNSVSQREQENRELVKEVAGHRAELERTRAGSTASEQQQRAELQQQSKRNETLAAQLAQGAKKLEQLQEEVATLRREKEALEKTSRQLSQKKANDGEINALKKRCETLEKDLGEEKTKHAEIRKKIDGGELVNFEDLRKAEQERHKLQKDITDFQRKISESEKKIAELEASSKEAVKTHRNLKRELEDAQKELETEKAKLKKVDSRQSEVAVGWLKERDELKRQLTEAQKKVETAEELFDVEEKKWKEKADSLQSELKKRQSDSSDVVEQKERELTALREGAKNLKARLDDAEEKLKTNVGAASAAGAGDGSAELAEKWRKLESQYRREKDDWQNRLVDLESELKTERKRRDRMERDHEVELRDRDEDMLTLKDKIRRADSEIKKMVDARAAAASSGAASGGANVAELHEKIKKLEQELCGEKRDYDELTAKYEMLEQDYVTIKSRLVLEKEQVESNFNALKRDHLEIDGELKALRETFNSRQDTWIKEKLDMQEKIKELTSKLARTNTSGWELERACLKDVIDEKNCLLEQLKKEDRALKEEAERTKRQTDDMRRRLEDYEKLKAYGKSVSGNDVTPYIKEIADLKLKLQQESKGGRADLASEKMKHDQRVAQLQDEIHALHSQAAKMKREKDTIKEMLEGAQKAIALLKTDTVTRERTSRVAADAEEVKLKLDELRREKEDILDKLDLAERAASKTKTEFMTEKASWEIRMAELQTRINELEETTILQGGKSKIFGMKSKLELAWQKEREEQHRLLTESHKMAKDLKERLLDVEAARDKERLDSKKHLDELRRTMEGEQHKTQKNIEELQNDLLDLRDEHSKVRGGSERVRRERDRLERERDEMSVFISESAQFSAQDRLTIASLLEETRKLKALAPSILGEKEPASSSGTGSKVSSAKAGKVDESSIRDEFKASLKRIAIATEELRRIHGTREEEKVKRNMSFRRAVSEDEGDDGPPATASTRRRDDPLSRWQNPQRVTNYPPSPPSMYISPPKKTQSLYRKSLSLDQNFQADGQHAAPPIWKSTDSVGSTTSLPAGQDVPTPSPRLKKHLRRLQQSSLDSDGTGASLSSLESSASELSKAVSLCEPPIKKRSGMRERLKRLTKSKSIEGSPTAEQIAGAGFKALSPGLGSNSSVTSESVKDKEKGKDLKSRIANLFKKAPSTGGSKTSLDREPTDGAAVAITVEAKSSTLKPKSSVSKSGASSTSASGTKFGTLPRYGSTSALTQLGKKY